MRKSIILVTAILAFAPLAGAVLPAKISHEIAPTCASLLADDHGRLNLYVLNLNDLRRLIVHAEPSNIERSLEGFKSLVAPYGHLVEHRETPNLLIFVDGEINDPEDWPEPQEVRAAVKYARRVAGRGETLVLLPSLNKVPVPAIDGLVFSRFGQHVANFTLKSWTQWTDALESSVDKLKKFMVSRGPWLSVTSRRFNLVYRLGLHATFLGPYEAPFWSQLESTLRFVDFISVPRSLRHTYMKPKLTRVIIENINSHPASRLDLDWVRSIIEDDPDLIESVSIYNLNSKKPIEARAPIHNDPAVHGRLLNDESLLGSPERQ